jgi:hypothetical protein
MTMLSLSDYLPVADLVKIVAVTLAVAVVAPSAASLAIVGLDRRSAGAVVRGNALVGIGACVLVLLVAAGLYALINR